MGQAKHAPTTPANRLQPRKRKPSVTPSRGAALASILTLSTAAGAGAIVVADALLPKPAKAAVPAFEQIPIPPWPDAHIHVAVARLMPEVQECQRLADVMNEKRRAAFAEVDLPPHGHHERLAEIGCLPKLAAAFDRHGYDEATAAWREAKEVVSTEVENLALLRPKTLPGFIAKARIARYHPALAIHIMRDLNGLDPVSIEGQVQPSFR